MAASFVAAGSVGTSSATYPGGIAAGDFLLMWITRSSSTPPTLPSGWTAEPTLGTVTAGGSSPSGRWCYKWATGSESGSVTVTTNAKAQILVFRGIDTTSPFADVDSYSSSTSVATYPVPAMTAPETGCPVVVLAAANSSAVSYSPIANPSTQTEVADDAAIPSTQCSYVIWTGSGSTGTLTATPSASARGFAYGLVLKPAATVVDIAPDREIVHTVDLTGHPHPITCTQVSGPTLAPVESPSNFFTFTIPFPQDEDLFYTLSDGFAADYPLSIGAPNARLMFIDDGAGGWE